jgi:hypothetical protein
MKWLALAVIILAQQPVKAPEGKGAAESNNAQSAARAKGAEGKQAPSAQSSPVPTQPPVTVEGQRSGTAATDHTGTSGEQTADEDRTTQRKLTWFTGILAVVGVLQAGIMLLQLLVYRRQAHEMKRQRHEMVRQRTELTGQRTAMESQLETMRGQLSQMENSGAQTAELIKHAGGQVTALTDSAQAAKEMAEAARINAMNSENAALAATANARAAQLSAQAIVNSERPWMILELTPVGGMPRNVYVAFHFWNRGRTPAEVIEYHGNFFYHGRNEPFNDEPEFQPFEGLHEYVSPGKSVLVYSFGTELLEHPAAENCRTSWEWMEKEQKYLYFFGHIVYRDLMTYESHESRFCYWLSPAPGVGLIIGGNRDWNKYT